MDARAAIASACSAVISLTGSRLAMDLVVRRDAEQAAPDCHRIIGAAIFD
jgi:hypothetical protein